MTKHDPVNHPTHYTSHPSGVECIEITRHMTFNCGNAVKYVWRNGLKDANPSVQDLEKAIWYLRDEINLINQEKQNAGQQELKLDEAAFLGQTEKDIGAPERTIECAACGYDIRLTAGTDGRYGHGIGCTNIPRVAAGTLGRHSHGSAGSNRQDAVLPDPRDQEMSHSKQNAAVDDLSRTGPDQTGNAR